MKKRNKLTLDERVQIYSMLKYGFSRSQIAGELNRHRSTITRELRRNNYQSHGEKGSIELARLSYDSFKIRRVKASSRMRLKSVEIQHYVELHLREAGWTPEQIAGKLRRLGYVTNYESIYQWINIERSDLKQHLKVAGKSRKRRKTTKRRKHKKGAANKRSIEQLPEAAKERREIGHFELDAVEGVKGSSSLQNLTDRKSRKIFLDKVPSLQAEEYAEVLIKKAEKEIPKKARKTILKDNGSENANHSEIDNALGTESYFCHPYCSSEKGTVENRNKIIRQFVSKGTDWKYIPDDWIEHIEDMINNTPMKLHNFKTPNEVWFEELNS